MEKLIKEFMAMKRFAVVGVSTSKEKFGYKIMKDLIARGYAVYPINPKINVIDGIKCYPSLTALPKKPDVVDIVVPPDVTLEIVKECKKLGLKRVWMQPGAESSEAIKYCEENEIKVVHDVCVMTS